MAAESLAAILRLLPGLSAAEKLRLVEYLASDVERELRAEEHAESGAESSAWERFLRAGEAVSRGWTSELTSAELLSSMRR